MDRVIGVQKMSVLDLIDAQEINKRASIPPPSEDDFENVLLVESPVAARDATITREKVRDILKFKKSFLRRLRPSPDHGRSNWQRFVLMKIDSQDGLSMYPRLLPGATVLIDRHYNSLEPYRKQEANMYVVRRNGAATVKYIELSGRTMILRPHNQACPVSILEIEEDKTAADYIVGRVCHVSIET